MLNRTFIAILLNHFTNIFQSNVSQVTVREKLFYFTTLLTYTHLKLSVAYIMAWQFKSVNNKSKIKKYCPGYGTGETLFILPLY